MCKALEQKRTHAGQSGTHRNPESAQEAKANHQFEAKLDYMTILCLLNRKQKGFRL